MEFFFNPESVAVIGASGKEGKIGYEIMNSLKHTKVKIYPVNKKEKEIMGYRCYESILDVKDKIDLSIIVLGARDTQQAVEECGKKGVKGIIIISGGFKELSQEGEIIENNIREIAKKYGMRIIGPNCIGVFSSSSGFDTFFQARDAMKRPGPGPVAFLTQSGTYGVTLLELMEETSIGVSKFVSFGNKVDVNEIDMLEYLENDNDTGIIALYLESFSNARKFAEISKRVSKKKPIVILKAGRSSEGTRAAKSHTGSLAENYSIFLGSMKQSGVIVVEDIEEMVDVIKILAKQPNINGGKVMLITNGAGPCVVTADEIGKSKILKLAQLNDEENEKLKKILPEYSIISNPLDLTGSATPEWYKKSMEILESSNNIDVFVLYFVIPNAPIYRNINELYELFRIKWKKPVIAVMAGGEFTTKVSKDLEKMNIPVITTARRLVNALEKVVEYSGWKNNRD